MYHDILLALLNPNEDKLAITEFMLSESSPLLHPGEYKILNDILKIANYHKEIRNFIEQYNKATSKTKPFTICETSENIVEDTLHGLYLQAFCDGLNLSLDDYCNVIVNLESRYLKQPNISLIYFYQHINKFEPQFTFQLRLIDGIKTQKLHGCAILRYLQQNSLQVDIRSKTIKVILKSVYEEFLKQLSQWLLYGKFVDKYSEFFIQLNEDRINTTGTGTTTVSDTTSLNNNLWQYDICYELLPHSFPQSWAENVLFIGQTVLMFNSAPPESSKRSDLWDYEEQDNSKASLFGNEKYKFFKKFNEFYDSDIITTIQIEQVVDEIKNCVTKHLSNIAINEADLLKQFKLIKDYYLLGRGELFLEFIKKLEPILKNPIGDFTMRETNNAFDAACSSNNVSDNNELFKFYIQRGNECVNVQHNEKDFLNYLTLKYKVKWPLHLIFTPKVLERYNDMFQFLFKIKMAQYDLNTVWSHHRENKLEKNSKILQLRNKLIFLIDNLQYYLQADVLESQFSILMKTISNSNDFEHIQKAHTFFQANILSLCFLINSNSSQHISVSKSTLQSPENPVYNILQSILNLVDFFRVFCLTDVDLNDHEIQKQITEYDKTFSVLVNSLLNVFMGLKAGPCNTPLSQLLLRLDFNYWFSSQISEQAKK